MVAHRSKAWRREHAATIGGSAAPKLLGVSRYGDAYSVWEAMRLVRAGGVPPELEINDDLRRGIRREPDALAMLGEALDVEVKPHDQDRFIYASGIDFAHALPDGWIGSEMVEVKVPRTGTVYRNVLGGPMLEYITQCQHNMAIANRAGYDAQVCYLGILCVMSEQIYHWPITYDAEFSERLLEHEQAFAASVDADEPPPQGEPAEYEQWNEDAIVIDDPAYAEMITAWFKLRGIADDVQEQLESIRQSVGKKMGKAHRASIPGLADIRYKPQSSGRGINRDALRELYPQVYKDSRVWKNYKPKRPLVVRRARG